VLAAEHIDRYCPLPPEYFTPRADYLLKVRTRNMSEYRQVLGEQISALPHVLQDVLKELRRAGNIFLVRLCNQVQSIELR
jgi:DNA-binding Lrp family transcriptional regulator